MNIDESGSARTKKVLSSLSEVTAILFDLGGTLWSPFGGKTRDEVLEFSTVRLIEDLKASTGKNISYQAIEQGIVNKLAGFGGKGCKEHQSSLEDDSLREINFYDVMREFLSSHGICLQVEYMHTLTDRFADNLSKDYVIYPETMDVLSSLRSRGYRLGIVSNTAMPPGIIDKYLAVSGIMRHIDFRVLSSEVGWRKPHRRIYEEALRLTDLRPDQVAFVGDRVLEDTVGPSAMGMRPILIRRDLSFAADPCDEYDGLSIASLAELI